MNQHPAVAVPNSRSKIRLLRLAASFGAALLLLASIVWPSVGGETISYLALGLMFVSLLTWIDRSLKLSHPRNLVLGLIIFTFTSYTVGLTIWRAGHIVAAATFNPGIAPFDITVREVPVPVTNSNHFIVTLKRGRYPVTSFRYFWIQYTPKKVRIEWTQLEVVRLIFDERYVATCRWSWGREATWTMSVPSGEQLPGDKP